MELSLENLHPLQLQEVIRSANASPQFNGGRMIHGWQLTYERMATIANARVLEISAELVGDCGGD